MTVMTPHTNPLVIAKESMAMSRESGSQVFQTVAMVTMGAMALAAVMQAGHVLLHDLNRKYDAERSGDRSR